MNHTTHAHDGKMRHHTIPAEDWDKPNHPNQCHSMRLFLILWRWSLCQVWNSQDQIDCSWRCHRNHAPAMAFFCSSLDHSTIALVKTNCAAKHSETHFAQNHNIKKGLFCMVSECESVMSQTMQTHPLCNWE